jgi:hypothetical protein
VFATARSKHTHGGILRQLRRRTPTRVSLPQEAQMNHLTLYWLALVAGSVLTGLSIVALLVAERAFEPVAAVTSLLGFVAASWGFGLIVISYPGADAIGYAALFGVAGSAGGFALASTLLAHIAFRSKRARVPDTHCRIRSFQQLSWCSPSLNL